MGLLPGNGGVEGCFGTPRLARDESGFPLRVRLAHAEDTHIGPSSVLMGKLVQIRPRAQFNTHLFLSLNVLTRVFHLSMFFYARNSKDSGFFRFASFPLSFILLT